MIRMKSGEPPRSKLTAGMPTRPLSRALAAAALALGLALPDPLPAQAQDEGAAPQLDLTDEEKAWLSTHPVIRVGAETNYAPYEFQDSRGRFAGVVADYLELIRRRLGARFEVNQLLDFEAIENKLKVRQLDVVLALPRTTDREEYLGFTRPYLHYVNVIVTRDDFGFVTGLRDFANERVAVVTGHSSQRLVARVYPNFSVTAYSDLLDALMAVSTGKEDGLLDDIFPIVYYIRHRQISNLKIATPVEKALQPQGFSIAVRKDWPELVGILDKVLLTITQEEQREISQKWLSVRYESKIDYRAIWTSVAVFSAILLAGVVWIRQLSRQRRALVAARAEAEAANRAKDEFLASMSHELRTPLHAILGYADLLREGALAGESRKEALATIGGSGRHLLALINDLLDLSRIRSGHLELDLAAVQLPALLEEIAAMMRVEAQKKGLTFDLHAPADLPGLVRADAKRLRQILLNLLGNAIKFTDAGHVVLDVEAALRDDGRVELRMEVEDTGIGIALQDRDRIFAPFEQSEEGQRRESGVGLGLAISQELAHLMGGRIEVDSRPGRGSRFRFTVALEVVRETQATSPEQRPVVGYQGPRRSILVVDDQEENRRLLRQMLAPYGFDVLAAGAGAEALDLARERRPDLIVMDLRMPGMNGFDAAAAIRALPGLQGVPLIAASASIVDLERAQSDPRTFAVCLRKPFQATDLLDAIERVLGLVWRYGDRDSAVEEVEASGATLAPSPRVLDNLLELARLGKLVRVEQIALELEASDPRYGPFARRVHSLARRFDEERLIAMLEESLEVRHDAVSD
jgi:signal transduction histidine kinase/DNA-binding NarL/FixJ family response regulator